MSYGITQQLPATRLRQCLPPPDPAITDRYSIYPPIKDERLSRPEPKQVKNLSRVATEVPAKLGVRWLSRPSASLGMVGVNN